MLLHGALRLHWAGEGRRARSPLCPHLGFVPHPCLVLPPRGGSRVTLSLCFQWWSPGPRPGHWFQRSAHVGVTGAMETAGSVTHHAVSPLIYGSGAFADFRSSVGTSQSFCNSMGFGLLASGACGAGRGH